MMRKSERRRMRNQPIRSALKTYIRKAERAIAAKAAEAQELVRLAASKLDSAATKGVIHRNNAARRKSRLMKKLNQMLAAS